MSIIYEERLSDSPYVETIIHGWTASDGSPIRPAECHWHMVFVRYNGRVRPLIVGPLTTAGVAHYSEGAEILWIKFKLGTFMPHLRPREFLDVETILPRAGSQSFWLNGSAWQFPDYDNVETFVEWLARHEVLVRDPVVNAALQDQLPEMSLRTVRHRFLRATGLTQSHIRQFERAQRAEALLKQGVSILDTVHELGYFDQPHLTRSLKNFIGHTPAQIIQLSKPEACHFIQDSALVSGYDTNVLTKIR
ncbi:MAG: helix-turn-helix domain-containing protein [Chloroflexi bacterium]|nr:helix-turn-helix domain-containing protein [Chloroflexota bacterium]MCI0648258.1 helix-turn-helix domain-containing protein [Chloroflexota bacterium]MCI0725922.1 helix-turn-helix domain-containing protein [Chloroflexota bacterium]